MKRLPKITIGLAGISFSPFYAFREEQYRKRMQELAACLKPWGARLVAIPRSFATADGARAAAARLREAKAALVILDIGTFPEGKAMNAFFEGITAPVAVWSRVEDKKCGPIGHNSFCGANFAASNLAVQGRRFRPLFGHTQDAEFQARLRTAVRLLQAAEAARGSMIGLLGEGIVPKFHDIDMTEAERASLAARWGVRFAPIPFESWLAEMARVPAAKAQTEAARQTRCYRSVAVPSAAIEAQARQLLALRQIVEAKNLAALAVRCWPEPQKLAASWPCGVVGHLNDLGIPTACEGDPVGAWDMLLARYLSPQPSTLMDIVDFDDRADALAIWHCGPSPLSWADKDGVKLIPHNVDGADRQGRPKPGLPCVHDMGFRQGEVTVLRTLGALDDEFIFEGRIVPRPAARRIAGSCGMVGELTQYGVRVSSRLLRTQILDRHIPHHYAVYRRS